MTVGELQGLFKVCDFCLPHTDAEICGCYIGDIHSHAMARLASGDIYITVMATANTLAVAYMRSASAVILCDCEKIPSELVLSARERGINIMASKLSAYQISSKLSEILQNHQDLSEKTCGI